MNVDRRLIAADQVAAGACAWHEARCAFEGGITQKTKWSRKYDRTITDGQKGFAVSIRNTNAQAAHERRHPKGNKAGSSHTRHCVCRPSSERGPGYRYTRCL